MSERSDDLLRCLVHIIGRASIPPETEYEQVGGGRNRSKRLIYVMER
jgi:hypothetical protein